MKTQRLRVAVFVSAVTLLFHFLIVPESLFAQDAAPDEEVKNTEVSDGEAVFELDEIIVTGRSIEEKLKESAHSIDIVSSEEIISTGARSADEALRRVPGVYLQNLGTRGESATLSIRGAKNGEVLVLLDGVRINSVFDSTSNLSLIPAELIDRIEVLRGSQAVLYGGRAIGGVVHIITKPGTEKNDFRLLVEMGNLGHRRELLTWRGSTAQGNVKYSLGVSRTDTEGISFQDSFRETAITQRWDFRPVDKLNMTLASHIFLQNKELRLGFLIGPAVLYDPSLPEDAFFVQMTRDNNRHYDSQIQAHSLRVAYDWNEMFKTELLYGFFLQIQEEKDSNQFDSGYLTPAGVLLAPNSVRNKIEDYRHEVDLRQFIFLPELGKFKQTLTIGFEFEDERVRTAGESPFPGDGPSFPGSIGPFIPPITTIPNADIPGDRQNYAPYFLYHLEYAERLIFDAGVRYDINSAYGNELSPRIALAVLIPEIKGKFHASYGEGFLPPTQLQLFDPLFGNPDLQPQRAQTYDVGYEQRIGEKARLFANFFYIDYDNLIDRIGTNTADAYVLGIETGFYIRPLPKLEIEVNYTWMDSRDETGTQQSLEEIPTHSLHARLWSNPWRSLQVSTDLSWISERRDTFPVINTDGVPIDGTLLDSLDGGFDEGHVLWNIGLSYEFDLTTAQQAHPRAIRPFLYLKNILNQEYDGVYGFPAPRFHFLGGAELIF